jgi:hypothetical protein
MVHLLQDGHLSEWHSRYTSIITITFKLCKLQSYNAVDFGVDSLVHLTKSSCTNPPAMLILAVTYAQIIARPGQHMNSTQKTTKKMIRTQVRKPFTTFSHTRGWSIHNKFQNQNNLFSNIRVPPRFFFLKTLTLVLVFFFFSEKN